MRRLGEILAAEDDPNFAEAARNMEGYCYTGHDFCADDQCVLLRAAWRTNDGKIIKYRDMTDQHLRNIILLIEREDPEFKYSRVYRGLKREQRYRRTV